MVSTGAPIPLLAQKDRFGPGATLPAEFCRTSRLCPPSRPARVAGVEPRLSRMPMDRLETPQTRCRAGFARADITPPVGIYHRLWGAALHERSTGVHRPLTATAMWMEPESAESRAGVPASASAGTQDRLKPGLQRDSDATLIITLDQCFLDASD